MWSTRAWFIVSLLVGPPVEIHAQPLDTNADPSTCDIYKPDKGCNQAQRQYILIWAGKSTEDMQKQIDELQGEIDKLGAAMDATKRTWSNQRVDILKQYVKHGEAYVDYSQCNMFDPEKGCNKAQRQYIANWAAKSAEEMQKELAKLQGDVDSQAASMKPSALTWAKQRIGILKQGIARHEAHADYSLCNIYESDKKCNQAQRQYITNWVDKPVEEMQRELGQLQSLIETDGASMKPHKLTWAEHRIGILKQLAKRSEL